ncbi:MAG: TraR/DksA C4-type zinc finger protein [Actinobacteria bacterium]|nr:TraR/DksA C4-type zinc finger protein [Actinomycetota bacterium]
MTAKRAVSARETVRLRRSLLQERASLHHELASLRGSVVEPFERDEHQELVGLLARSLREVEDALMRLDRGTFGRCEECGRPIPVDRLRALPRARLCVRCQRREDRRSRRLRSVRSGRRVA